MTRKREYAVGVFYLALTALCWGFVASTVKRLTQHVDPYTISFFRVFLAAVVFAVILGKRGWRGLPWFLPWTLAGVVGRSGNYLLYNAGLTYMPSNAVTILAPVQAVGTVLLARWFLGERVHHKWLGLLLSVGGLLLIWWSGQGWQTLLDPRYALGNTLFVLAGLGSALQFTSQKALSARFSGVQILFPVFVISSMVTAPVALAAGTPRSTYPLTDWALLLFLGLVLTGGSFYFLGQGYKRCDASTAVVITNTSTFLTLLWSWVLLHERVSVAMIAGAVLGVAGAIVTVNADRSRAAASQREATAQRSFTGGK